MLFLFFNLDGKTVWAHILVDWWVYHVLLTEVTEVWHMAHFWVSYGRCTMPGSPMGRSEGLSRCWTG